MDTNFSPGTTVKILSVDNKGDVPLGLRYGIILGPKTKRYDKKDIAGYDVLVGSKIEWHLARSLFLENDKKRK